MENFIFCAVLRIMNLFFKKMIEMLSTVITWKSAYDRKEYLLQISPPPFEVKYLMSAFGKWAPLFSLKRGAHLTNIIKRDAHLGIT